MFFDTDYGDKCYVWTTFDELTGVAITDKKYGDDNGFILINKLLSDFRDYFKASPSDYENVLKDMT